MKRKVAQSAEASCDYRVGQVSDSLGQNARGASGSLSALFGAAAPTASGGAALFRPAPQLPQPSGQSEAAEVKVGAGDERKRKKKPKVKTEAERKLEDRELSLRDADEDERAPADKKKRGEAGLDKGAERRVLKRQRRRQDKQEEQTKNRRTVFVGNLPVNCTKKMLLGMFRPDGAVESIRFRSMVREDPAVSRRVAAIKRQAHLLKQSINAYVVFKEPQGVAKALQRNGTEVENGFIIRVDRVRDEKAERHDHKRSVFVGNLNFELKELALRRHFEECGVVEAVRLVRDRNTGLGKGFGYVLFESSDSVQLALKLEGSPLEGRPVRVKRSAEKDRRGAPRRTTAAGNRVKGPRSKNFKGEIACPNPKTKKKVKKIRKNVHI
ncbi:RNA-binding protein 34 isoform X2 [Syngnathoides biaculeatus]|uniref:RNA-binding protein 34 isoform X2 n=1 Tax=Syngnathoides biaculeatus TaxID=300417 RepID=UPI002ADD6CBA|nr:RNA-binding protein 34 isoform X2 [Syngnathoides biaculeatus]